MLFTPPSPALYHAYILPEACTIYSAPRSVGGEAHKHRHHSSPNTQATPPSQTKHIAPHHLQGLYARPLTSYQVTQCVDTDTVQYLAEGTSSSGGGQRRAVKRST